MGSLIILPIILVAIIVTSYFIAKGVYNKLVTNKNHYPVLISASVFVLSFCIISMIILFIILSNLEFNRGA